MAQISDWISRLFGGGSAQGLSGDAADQALDPSPYFNSRLRKHRTQGDLIEDPFLLWSAGLKAHLQARREDGAADFTDVLVVVSEPDFARSFGQVSEPWTDTAGRMLHQQFQALCKDEGYELLFGARGLRFRILQDGHAQMVGNGFDLQAGEFVTGLMPNHYTGPISTSRPVIAVHLNLPDVWEGYREVGRLYNDQVVFTLGNHWLDNFSHFTMQEPALYRLQQYLDGSFVHIIDPDQRDRYTVVSQDEGGANVLTIMDSNGEAVAHLVLALLDSVVPEASEPDDVALGSDGQPRIELPTPAPVSLEESIDRGMDSLVSLGHGSKTIVPESLQERIFTLRERGALLQKVHFRKFMQGYDVYVSSNGALTTKGADRAATFQVRNDKVSLIVHRSDVLVNGRPVPTGTPMPLYSTTSLQVGPHTLEYQDLSGSRSEPGWPYLGQILRPASSTHMVFGGSYRIGRDRRCKVQLPDEPQNDNIEWLPSLTQGATIRARSGDIPKSRFYTDSIMVASEHAEIDLSAGPRLTSIARHCYTYIRRGGQIIALTPAKQAGRRDEDLRSGDQLLVGNCLFEVSYPPEDGQLPEPAPPPPAPRLTAESLAKAVSQPGIPDTDSEVMRAQRRAQRGKQPQNLIDEILQRSSPPALPEEATDVTPRPLRGSLDEVLESKESQANRDSIDELLNDRSAVSSNFEALLGERASDVPVAGGLGEDGTPPPKPDLGIVSYDSLIGEDDLPPSVVESVEDDSSAPSILPHLETLPPVEQDLTDEGGEAYGLPSPDSPRTDFDLASAGTAPRERHVHIETFPQETARPSKTTPPPPIEPSLDEPADEVVVVDDEQGGVELARPARLTALGWALSGEVTIGNHAGCTVAVPETRYDEDQVFSPRCYFKLKVRGRRNKAWLMDADEAALRQGDERPSEVKDLEGVRLEILRRDEDGEEDFSVFLALEESLQLPDPRARLLAVDYADRIVEALFTRGLPLNADRVVQLGPILATARFDGQALVLANYLDSYRSEVGRYQPFFVQHGQGRFTTVPEDGRELRLEPGDLLIAGNAVFRFALS
jgi:hypothetical protein